MRLRRRNNRRSTSGSTLVEFAVGLPILVLLVGGIFQYGYAFYLYHGLQVAVRSGARYAAIADYDTPSGTSFDAAVKNLVVYGNLTPQSGDPPAVPGLTTAAVTIVTVKDPTGVPIRVTVSINSFVFDAVWSDITYTNKPSSSFPYQGQVL